MLSLLCPDMLSLWFNVSLPAFREGWWNHLFEKVSSLSSAKPKKKYHCPCPLLKDAWNSFLLEFRIWSVGFPGALGPLLSFLECWVPSLPAQWKFRANVVINCLGPCPSNWYTSHPLSIIFQLLPSLPPPSLVFFLLSTTFVKYLLCASTVLGLSPALSELTVQLILVLSLKFVLILCGNKLGFSHI